jgi:hypothetical protein
MKQTDAYTRTCSSTIAHTYALAHCTHTACTLHAHCTHTARTLHAHCTHTARTLHAPCEPGQGCAVVSPVRPTQGPAHRQGQRPSSRLWPFAPLHSSYLRTESERESGERTKVDEETVPVARLRTVGRIVSTKVTSLLSSLRVEPNAVAISAFILAIEAAMSLVTLSCFSLNELHCSSVPVAVFTGQVPSAAKTTVSEPSTKVGASIEEELLISRRDVAALVARTRHRAKRFLIDND